ncbi:MAG: tRNA pseudouridine(55) synthase TruB [Spirochaetaceae bacterium]|nr:tRNA pseudouridine(55) synthase TruB [Spirochaetaceae bacterium]
MNRSSGGLVLLDKPAGVTSFAALSSVKKSLGTKKVGHTGTLDKFASGLLVALCGSYTRLAPFITSMDKTYDCVFEFGAETSTLDPEGEIIARADLPREDDIRAAAQKFTGEFLQRPPEYSAVHIDGKRSSRRARSGETPEPPLRQVTVYAFTLQDWNPPLLSCRVHCGKGTYVRSLARDVGKLAGSRAYVRSLRRLGVGPFRVEDAGAPGDFERETCLARGREILAGLLPGTAVLRAAYAESLFQGKPPCDEFFDSPPESGAAAVFTEAGELAAVIEKNANGYAYHFVCGRGTP